MVSNAIKSRIVKLRLEGLGRNETHRALKRYVKSSATVSTEFNEFKKIANEQGLDYAGKVYNVKDTVDKLVEIGKVCRKSDMDPAEALERAKEAEKLKKLQSKYGLSFPKLHDSFKEMGENLPKLREQLEDLKTRISELESKKTEALRRQETTETDLEHYKETRKFLNSVGLVMSDLDKTKNFFLNLKTEKFKVHDVISKLNDSENLDSKISEKHELLDNLKNKEKVTRDSLEKITIELDHKRSQLALAQRIEKSKLPLDFIERAKDTILNISKKQGISPPQATQRFFGVIGKDYDLLLSIRKQIDNFRKERKEHVAELGDLDRKIGVRKKAIEAYSKIRSKGVDDSALLRWANILDNTKLDPKLIEADLRETATLKHAQDKIHSEIKRLEDHRERILPIVKTLTKRVRDLRYTERELKSSIATITNELKESLELLGSDAKEKMKVNSNEVQSELTKANENVRKLATEVAKISKDTTSEVKKAVSEVKSVAEDSKAEIADVIQLAKEAGEKIGKLDPIVKAYEFLSTGQGGKDLLPMIITLLKNLKQWCRTIGVKDWDTPIDCMIMELEKI